MNRERPRRSSDDGQRRRGPAPRRLARSACDGAALALVLLALIVPVLAAGGALSWVPFFLQTVAAGLAICWCARSGPDGGRSAARPQGLSWIAFLGALVALPLLPLPPSWIGLLSPRAHEIARTALPGWPERAPFAELASSMPDPRGWLPFAWRPLAVAPDATRDALLLGAAYAVIAGAVAAYPWNERSQKPLGVAVNALIVLGVFESLYSFLQYSLGGGRLLWFECGPATSCTGTYVNRNHFAGFLEMVLPLAVARAAGARARVRADLGPAGGSWLRLADGAFRSGEAGRSAAYASVALLLAVALAASGSRGGLVCAAVALLATWLIAPGRRGSVGWRIPVSAIAGLILLATFPQLVYRWSFDDPTRRSLALETIAMAADFPLAGVGLGGFAMVHPLYRSRTHILGAFPIEHAHDDYLQWAAETGIASALLAFALLVALARRVVRRLAAARSGLDADAWALWGSAAAALGLLLHSLVDFNLHAPANAVILAFLVGALVRSTSAPDRAPATYRLGRIGRVVLLLASFAWLLGIRQSWLADAAWERSRPPSVLNDLSATEPVPSADESIAAVERAVVLAPRVARFSADLGRRLLDREGPAERAVGALVRSIELSPMQPWTLIDLASAAAASREPALAADLIARAARLAPYDAVLRRRVERWRDDPASIAKRDHDADR